LNDLDVDLKKRCRIWQLENANPNPNLKLHNLQKRKKKKKKKKRLIFEIWRFQRWHHVNIDSDANCFMHKQHVDDEFGL